MIPNALTDVKFKCKVLMFHYFNVNVIFVFFCFFPVLFRADSLLTKVLKGHTATPTRCSKTASLKNS